MARSMKYVVCFAAVTLVVSFPSDNVKLYEKNEFDLAVVKRNLFVLFCNSTVNACERVAPAWEELRQLYSSSDSAVIVAQVNCATEMELCADQKVRKVPVFRFFYRNPRQFTDFLARRTFDSLHRFVEDELHNAVDIKPTTPSSAVLELDSENFKEFISESLHFVKFHTPWCGHCKMLSTIWHDLAMEVAGGHFMFISQVDCSKAKDVCDEYGIKAYPSLVLFLNGTKVEKYEGDRTLEDLKEYVHSKMDEHVQEEVPEVTYQNGIAMLTDASFSHVVDNHLVFVNFYTSWCLECKDLQPVWEQLASTNQDRDITIAAVDCEEHSYTCETRSINVFPTLILYKEGLHVVDYTGGKTQTDLQQFIDQFTIPTHEEL